jgi:hypothetical protein
LPERGARASCVCERDRAMGVWGGGGVPAGGVCHGCGV